MKRLDTGLEGWQRYFESMREEEKDGQTCILEVGDKVRLTKDIWDGGEDCYPPGFIAFEGEEVFIRSIRDTSLSVSHPGVIESSFTIYPGEYVVI